MRLVLALLSLLTFPAAAQRVLHVGAGQQYPTLKSFPNTLLAGDQIILEPGVYLDPRALPVAGTPDNPVVIRCAVDWAPVVGLEATKGQGPCILDGVNFNFAFTPRAFLEVSGGAYTFQGLDIRNVSNGGTNASGIRCIAGTQCILRRVRIRNSDMGLQTTAPDLTVVEECDIQWNGRGANSHNIYASGGKHSIVKNSLIGYTTGGMNVKLRTVTALVEHNKIFYSKDGELQCTYWALPNGTVPTSQPGSDCIVQRNEFRTLAAGRGNCCRVTAFGHEGDPTKDRNGTLRLLYNTFQIGKPDQVLVSLDSINAGLEAVGNSVAGTNILVRLRYGASGPQTGSNNQIVKVAGVSFPLEAFPALFVPPTTPVVDATPPAAPANLAATQSARAILLTWTPSPDLDIDHYEISGPYGPFSMGDMPAYSVVAGLYAGRSYTFAVVAVDTSGNRSQPSAPITVVRQ